ncbi:DUF3098 domain-containing protein [Mucilaginibacter lacusdianchii]|uniref:DUF3098 domain-containing protein n=1 Tax=Mucilaginibacter lacusdianchii TaxID=2684211 RepID=UPI00131DD565|nr:DUF3098 domain-containing protein [Mucilaginibacter sp. JXJ CY 39]
MAQKYTSPLTSASKPYGAPENKPVQFAFGKANYQLLAASVVIVALGFMLMSGTTDIYSNTKIVIAPLVVLAGFGLAFYAIFKKPSSN